MREPLPKEWLIEAWKARVGAIGDRCAIQRAYKQVLEMSVNVRVKGQEEL